MQNPKPEHESGQSGCVQLSPDQPALHTHGPSSSLAHRPRLSVPHSLAAHSRCPAVEFLAIEQSVPLNASSHTQCTSSRWLTAQRPWPEHVGLPGHVDVAQSRPVQPVLHTQSPS